MKFSKICKIMVSRLVFGLLVLVIITLPFAPVVSQQTTKSSQSGTTRLWSTIQSALIPGLGQISQDREGAGYVYGTLFWGGLFAWYSQDQTYQSSRNSLDQSDVFFDLHSFVFTESPTTTPAITAARNTMGWELRRRQFVERRTILDLKKKKRDETASFLAALYVWNIGDALIFYGSDNDRGHSDQMGALWRSALLPGWGQRYQGRGGMGWMYTGSFIALGMATRSHFQEVRLKKRNYDEQALSVVYLSPAFINLFVTNTNEYNVAPLIWNYLQTQNARHIMLRESKDNQKYQAGVAALYLWNLADVFLFKNTGGVSFGMGGQGDGLGFQMSMIF